MRRYFFAFTHKIASAKILIRVSTFKEEYFLATGYIVVNVYTSRAQIPIRNAQVSVTAEGGDKPKLLGFRTTNENGKTSNISVETPSLESSLSPSETKPFSVCTLKVSHPSYYSVTITDVQVFANTQTLQNVELIPLEENSKPENRSISRTTPAQNL